jgi:hypothetical protein
MASLSLDNPPRTGYGSLLVRVRLGSADTGSRARLLADGHQLKLEPSMDHLAAWVPMDLVDRGVDVWIEVDFGSGQWAKSGATYRLAREPNGCMTLTSL